MDSSQRLPSRDLKPFFRQLALIATDDFRDTVRRGIRANHLNATSPNQAKGS